MLQGWLLRTEVSLSQQFQNLGDGELEASLLPSVCCRFDSSNPQFLLAYRGCLALPADRGSLELILTLNTG